MAKLGTIKTIPGPRELKDARMAASLSTTVPCTPIGSSVLRFPPPRMAKVLSLFLALALLRPPTSSGTSPEPILVTSCTGKSPSSTSSSHAATRELATFLAAVCAGAVGAAAHMSHSMSSVAGTMMYGVAQCRPHVPVHDCTACLAAASSLLVIAGSGRTPCAAGAAWHDACFLRYSDRDPSVFREDDEEYTATRGPHGGGGGKAAVRRRLLAADGYHDIVGTRGNGSVSPKVAAPPAPAPPAAGGHTPPPSAPAAENPPPPRGEVHHQAPPLSHPAATPSDQTQVTQQSHGKTRKKLIMLAVSVAIALMVVASVILVTIIWYRRKQAPARRGHVIDGMQGDNNMYEQVEEQSSTEEKSEDRERTTCQLYSYQVLENATHHFSNSNKLGSGGFGTVFRGTLENGKEVAVKRIRDSKRNIQELEREISMVSDLHHKNLVRFLGYCFQEEGRFLVYEYVPNNSLEKFWYKACFQSQKLEWTTWFNIIKGVAHGLQFLHDKGIIHRDLKPHNVLLDENFNPKIADFDLMRMYDKQKTHESTEKVAGTFGYMAPECTSGRKFLLSIKSDVYSYGVLVLEIITGHKIYTFEGQNSEGLVEYVWQHWTEKRVSDVVDGDLGVDVQEHALRQALRCVHIALLCVQSDRSKRPTMGHVIAMLMSSDDATEALPEPSLPGYVVRRPTAAAVGLLRLPCLGRR